MYTMVVESATVKQYHTDKDDLRVATKHALEKIAGAIGCKAADLLGDHKEK